VSDVPMTKKERDELARLVRRREKLAKLEAERLAAERLAEFEKEVASDYHVDDETVWKEALIAASSAVNEANEQVLARCRELGIRDEFAPQISKPSWYSRGRNSAEARVQELRKIAKTRIDADLRAVMVEVEHRSLEVQTELIAGALTSDEAQRFLERMPLVSELVTPLSVAEIEAAERHGRSDPDRPPF
jgi:hypothetical protein